LKDQDAECIFSISVDRDVQFVLVFGRLTCRIWSCFDESCCRILSVFWIMKR